MMNIVNKILKESLLNAIDIQKLLLSRSITSFQLCKDDDYVQQEYHLTQINKIKQKLISLGMTNNEVNKLELDFSSSDF